MSDKVDVPADAHKPDYSEAEFAATALRTLDWLDPAVLNSAANLLLKQAYALAHTRVDVPADVPTEDEIIKAICKRIDASVDVPADVRAFVERQEMPLALQHLNYGEMRWVIDFAVQAIEQWEARKK